MDFCCFFKARTDFYFLRGEGAGGLKPITTLMDRVLAPQTCELGTSFCKLKADQGKWNSLYTCANKAKYATC